MLKNIVPVIIRSPWMGELNAQRGVASALVADPFRHIIVPDYCWRTDLEKQFKRAIGDQLKRRASWKICFEDAQRVVRQHCHGICSNSDVPVIINIGGRDSSAFLSFAAKSMFSDAFLLNIQYPNLAADWYDLLALPPVEPARETTACSLRIGSVPNLVSDPVMAEGRKEWSSALSLEGRKTIAVIVGGYTGVAGVGAGVQDFTLEHGRELIGAVKKIQEEMQCALLLTTSRRTPDGVTALLKDQLAPACTHSYFGEEHLPNPLMGYLACADAFVVTADSMSMMSEAADTGKPVYTYLPKGILSKEHQMFYSALLDNGHIRALPASIDFGKGSPIRAANIIADHALRMIERGERSPQPAQKIISGECAL